MAISARMKERIEAYVRELAEEFGEVDDSDADSWLDAVENRAVEIGDTVAAELMKQQSADRPADDEATCPQCGKPGRYRGLRQRELVSRRGPATIAEPEYFCPCCRKAFFPSDTCVGR
jgi:hypothetical protein